MKEIITDNKKVTANAKDKASSTLIPKYDNNNNNNNKEESPKNPDEILDILESDYKSSTNMDTDNNNLSKRKKNNFREKNNKKSSSVSINPAVNKLKKNFKLLVRYNEIFKNKALKSLSSSETNTFLSKLQNDIFSSYKDLNALAILIDSDSELKIAIQNLFNCEDIIEQCSMHAYNLYSYVKMFQYKNFYLTTNEKDTKLSATSNDNNDNNIDKTFKFRSEDLDSLRQIRSGEIHRLDSKPAMSLSKNQATNLSDYKEEKINMEGEKSRLRINRLSNNRLKELSNSITNSQMLLNNAILSSSAELSSFALSSSNLAVNSSNLISKMDIGE